MRQVRKMLKTVAKYVQRRIAEKFGFVLWVPDYKVMHHALTAQDAKEWVLCYPEDAKMFLYYRGEMVTQYETLMH